MATPRRKPNPPKQEEVQVDTRWWIIVKPRNFEAGRYGVWRERPKCVMHSEVGIARYQGDADEPYVDIAIEDTLSVTVAQIAHLDASPVVKEETSAAD